MSNFNILNFMKYFYILLILGILGGGDSLRASRSEISVGATFMTKTDFWVYEIQGRLPYGKEVIYVMNSSRGSGIGGDKFKYVATLPAGTKIRVVNLVKRSKREYFYIIRIVGVSLSPIEDAPVAIFYLSMLRETLRGPVSKRVKLHPDLFDDYADKSR